jgi:hypothetical protein
MKFPTVLLLLATAAPAPAGLTPKQMAAAEATEAFSVPSPAEFFAAIDKAGKPDWAAFYREPVPTTYPTRPQTAVNLGALVADGFVAVEAEDGQQVKNTGKDIIALARALGVGENVLARGKSISDFADKNDWFALREELEATANEVRRAMADQRDEAMSSLITAGAWIRALDVGSRAALLAGEPPTAGLLAQPDLADFLRTELQKLPDKALGDPVTGRVEVTLAALREQMTTPDAAPPGPERIEAIHSATSSLIAELSAKQP